MANSTGMVNDRLIRHESVPECVAVPAPATSARTRCVIRARDLLIMTTPPRDIFLALVSRCGNWPAFQKLFITALTFTQARYAPMVSKNAGC
jgi:hypothetical protein